MLFHSKQNFSTWLYKNENNYDYDLTIYTPKDKEFEGYELDLAINQTIGYYNIKYLTHVPLYIKIQKTYFGNDKILPLKLSSFINNFLTLYQYFFNEYGIPTFKLDGRKILCGIETNHIWCELDYKSLSQISFYEHLQESIVFGEASPDLVCSLAAEREPLEFNWTLLVDSIRNFYEGNFRQTVINCCTSLEVTITEPVKDWLLSFTFTKNKEPINQLIYEISNPLKFEFFINTVNPEPYKIYDIDELGDLISKLKFLNSIRNRVAHQGYHPTQGEAMNAVEATSKFLKALWVFERETFYKDLKKR